MVSVMNEYTNKINLNSDDITKAIFDAALSNCEGVDMHNIQMKANRYIIDIRLQNFTIENAVMIMNHFMENSRYHYSAFYIRYNEGNMIRYRYASCKENKDGFYCDVMIS